jgi:serine/threonine protein kinase
MSEPTNWNELKGRLLEGRYRLDAPIAEGGFGVVFEGSHLALNTKVAVKILRYPQTTTAAQRQHLLSQFVAEGQLLAKLRHPNIVSALDVGTFELNGERTAFLVLEWCGGRDLHDDLRTRRGRGGRSVASVWRLLSPICDALAHAHATGCVHRDVKPANVMFVDGGLTKLIDFGIAKETPIGEAVGSGATRTQSTHRAFSLHYAAPEQLAGSKTGPWTDVHALGLLFTELLVDRPPYGEDDVPLAVIDANRPSPAAFGVDVGPWEPILRRAVSPKPADRQRNAGALREELEQALAEAGRVQARAATQRVSLPDVPEPSPDAVTRQAEGTILTASASIQVVPAPVVSGVARTGDRELSAARTTGGSPPRRYWPWAIGATLLLGVGAVVARMVPSEAPMASSGAATSHTAEPIVSESLSASAVAPTPIDVPPVKASAEPEPTVAIATASARRAQGATPPVRVSASAAAVRPPPSSSAPAKETLY